MNRFTPYCLLACLLVFCGKPQAQVTLTDSNLPIVIISMDGNGGIPDEPKALGNMKIIYSGPGLRNFKDETDLNKINYNGRIGIEVRGSSSQAPEKKQYGLTTLKADNVSNNNVSLLGMPAENDWILSSLAFDASLMRDHLSFTLSRRVGQYAPRTQYCELIINGNYRGIYMLVEKIKVDDDRVDITKIKSSDNTLPGLSGGYITKSDKIAGVDVSAWRIDGTDFVHEFPKANEVTSAQNNYIQSVFFNLESNASSAVITNGFPSIIDVPSFIDFMIINELGSNVDAYQFSTYFHKDKNAKLRAGPIWDSNLTYGYDLVHWGLNRSFPTVWQFNNGDNIGPNFWRSLFNNPTFKCYLSKRWNELIQPGQPLCEANLHALVDETATLLTEASVREHTRWDNNYYSDYYTDFGLDPSLAGQVNLIKSFITQRLPWMTANLGSFNACNNVSKPPLVITRIDYRPATNTTFPDSDDQEFIEITNTSNQTVTLTGLYFSGTGFVYQFPEGAELPGNGVIQLANKQDVFFQKYGYAPYGQFTRDLSNTGQNLTLADAFGNAIDQVIYSSESPWPDANGNGKYLKLVDPTADNGLASNWVASSDPVQSTIVVTGLSETSHIEVYPNPSNGDFHVTANASMERILLYNSNGQLVQQWNPNSLQYTFKPTQSSSGFYTLLIQIGRKQFAKKIFKQ